MKKALLIPVYFLVVIFAVSCKKEHPAIGVTNPEGLYTLRIKMEMVFRRPGKGKKMRTSVNLSYR
jgi:hypothetical protein